VLSADWNIPLNRSQFHSRTRWHGELGRRRSGLVFVDGHAIMWYATLLYESYPQSEAADPDNGMY
jgi:hypothetical protein